MNSRNASNGVHQNCPTGADEQGRKWKEKQMTKETAVEELKAAEDKLVDALLDFEYLAVQIGKAGLLNDAEPQGDSLTEIIRKASQYLRISDSSLRRYVSGSRSETGGNA